MYRVRIELYTGYRVEESNVTGKKVIHVGFVVEP